MRISAHGINRETIRQGGAYHLPWAGRLVAVENESPLGVLSTHMMLTPVMVGVSFCWRRM